MINALTTKLEIDIMQASEVDNAMQLAAVHRLPAVVVHPQLLQQAIMTKIKRNGMFKLLTTIDWPKGDIYGVTKLRGMTNEMMDIDGYEIMMTGGKTEIENRNEAKTITEFIKRHIGERKEIRFVLGCFTRQNSETVQMASIMKDIIAPAMIRTDPHVKTKASKTNAEAQTALLQSIKEVCGIPIKMSGNFDSVRSIATFLQHQPQSIRFAVSTQQLQQVIKDLQKQPDELRQLLIQ